MHSSAYLLDVGRVGEELLEQFYGEQVLVHLEQSSSHLAFRQLQVTQQDSYLCNKNEAEFEITLVVLTEINLTSRL